MQLYGHFLRGLLVIRHHQQNTPAGLEIQRRVVLAGTGHANECAILPVRPPLRRAAVNPRPRLPQLVRRRERRMRFVSRAINTGARHHARRTTTRQHGADAVVRLEWGAFDIVHRQQPIRPPNDPDGHRVLRVALLQRRSVHVEALAALVDVHERLHGHDRWPGQRQVDQAVRHLAAMEDAVQSLEALPLAKEVLCPVRLTVVGRPGLAEVRIGALLPRHYRVEAHTL